MLQAGGKMLGVAVVLVRERFGLTLLQAPDTTLVNAKRAAVLALGKGGLQGGIIRCGLPRPKAQEGTADENDKTGPSEKPPPPGYVSFAMHATSFPTSTRNSP